MVLATFVKKKRYPYVLMFVARPIFFVFHLLFAEQYKVTRIHLLCDIGDFLMNSIHKRNNYNALQDESHRRVQVSMNIYLTQNDQHYLCFSMSL